MKRKKYLHFAVPRVMVSLLIGATVFGILFSYLERVYNYSIDSGFDEHQDYYDKLIKGYAEDKYDKVFFDIFLNFFTADYYRFAKVNEDGSFETITETDYNTIRFEDHMRHWYFVTNDESLLAEGEKTEYINDNDWTIEYKKCDEAWNLNNLYDYKMTNSWDLTETAGDLYYSNYLFQLATAVSGSYHYSYIEVHSYYDDGDTLHLGKVSEMIPLEPFFRGDRMFGKKWDFTDPAKADLYRQIEIIDGEEIEQNLSFFSSRTRPDEFLDKTADIFLADNINDLKSAFKARIDSEDYSEFYTGTNMTEYEREFSYYVERISRAPYTKGSVRVYDINGEQYMAEYILTAAPFIDFCRPFIILMAAAILILCLAVSLIMSVPPYLKYRKAYENNAFKNNLIDSLAHNMKTPLQILGGYAENLKDVKSDVEKNRYADQILAKTSEMNKDIEAILKSAEKSDRKLKKASVRACVEDAAKRAGAEPVISGDAEIRMDRDYFGQALYCLIDNASKYKTEGTKTEIRIMKKVIAVTNRTDNDKFTPGTGLAIAGRILEQHRLKLTTKLEDGVFEALISRK